MHPIHQGRTTCLHTCVYVGGADVEESCPNGGVLPDLLTVGHGIKDRGVVIDILYVHVDGHAADEGRAAAVIGCDVQGVQLHLEYKQSRI